MAWCRAERLRGVESKYNEQDIIFDVTQFRLLFLYNPPLHKEINNQMSFTFRYKNRLE